MISILSGMPTAASVPPGKPRYIKRLSLIALGLIVATSNAFGSVCAIARAQLRPKAPVKLRALYLDMTPPFLDNETLTEPDLWSRKFVPSMRSMLWDEHHRRLPECGFLTRRIQYRHLTSVLARSELAQRKAEFEWHCLRFHVEPIHDGQW